MIPSKCSNSIDHNGRPSGGLAILWRKCLNIKIELVSSHDNYMITLLRSQNTNIGLVNIYMPYDDRSSVRLTNYSHILGELQASLDELPTENIICAGDFNADPKRGRAWLNLCEFCDSSDLVIVDNCLPLSTFTYLSMSHNSTSWIDHVLCSSSVIVDNIKVMYDASLFRFLLV